MFHPDFSQLFERYPTTISQMPDKFDSDEFIFRLAQENQKPYIEALYHYPESAEPASPFMVVHGILARHLNEYPELIKQIDTVQSKHIFGLVTACGERKKIV